jgi:serine/threonine-protein kinase
VGTQLGEADAALRGAGFDVEVQRKDDESRPRDQVIEQTPPGGTGMAKATGKVVLVVANGPPGPPMPSVVGLPCPQATGQLQQMGLQVIVHGNDIDKAFGTAREQAPGPNEPVQPGQQVQIRCAIF